MRKGIVLGACVLFGLATPAQETMITPVTDAMLQNPDPSDWLMWRRTLDSWGYSPLNQIDRANVDALSLVWSRPLSEGVQEGTPAWLEAGSPHLRAVQSTLHRQTDTPALHRP